MVFMNTLGIPESVEIPAVFNRDVQNPHNAELSDAGIGRCSEKMTQGFGKCRNQAAMSE